MELELNRIHLAGYETVLDTTVFQEETLETIVPDACPDILRIVNAEGKVILKSKEASDGRITVTGTAKLSVLYLPDGGSGPCRLEANIPFTAAAESRRAKSDCVVTVSPRIQGADARAVNPRKVLILVGIALHLRAYDPEAGDLCTGAAAINGTVEQLKESRQLYCVVGVKEKPFSFADELLLPAGRPEAEELLGSRLSLSCHESKIIGNKLIFKGDALVQLLYRPAGGGVGAADFTLPFSQIAELSDVGEDAQSTIELAVTGADLLLKGDGRTVSISLSLLAQAVVRESRTVEVLSDAYSTCCALHAERVPYRYQLLIAEGVGRQSVREIIETGLTIKSVVDAYVLVGETRQSWEGGQIRLAAALSATALCITEDDVLCAVSRRLEASCTLDVFQECSCIYSCRCGNLTATPTADGVEVRFPLEFPYQCLTAGQTTVVRDLRVDENAPQDSADQPSIVLRVLKEGERLWDVAKRYGTTAADIGKANALEDERPACGTLLLIPKKR